MKPCRQLAAAFLLFCCSCQPSDRDIKSLRQHLQDGQKVDFQEPGFSLCSNRRIWSEFRVSDSERMRVVQGQQGSFVSPGHDNVCYRVQDEIPMSVTDRQIDNPGRLRVERIALVHVNHLSAKNLMGLYFTAPENVNSLKEDLHRRLRPEHDDIVTIVDISYQSGSAADESELRKGKTP